MDHAKTATTSEPAAIEEKAAASADDEAMSAKETAETPETPSAAEAGETPEAVYAIADISAKTGLSIDVIRYYERVGLLPQPKRKQNGHRIYSQSDLARYMFVTHLKRTQMPLKEIERYIRFYNERRYEQCYAVLAGHKLEVERQIAELTVSLGMLNYKLDNYKELINQSE